MSQRLLAAFLAVAPVVCAQRHVDPRYTYYRVICVVPLAGQGTKADPIRPMYAPTASDMAAAETAAEAAAAAAATAGAAAPVRTDIIAYAQQISDDGKYAIVEFVAQSRTAFQAIFNDTSNVAVLFEKGKSKKEDIEKALQKYSKNFSLDSFGVVMP